MANTKMDLIEVLQEDDWRWCAGEMETVTFNPRTKMNEVAVCALVHLLLRAGFEMDAIVSMSWFETERALAASYRLGERELPPLAATTVLSINDKSASKRAAVESIIDDLLAMPLEPVRSPVGEE